MASSAKRSEEWRDALTLSESMAQMTTSLALKGTVVAVASNAKHEFSKPTKDAIRLVEDHGVEGDAHAGRFIQHRFLAKKMPVLPNNRQVHIMASELFTELASSGFNVAPGDLGENVTTAGLELTKFPLGTRLRMGSSAIVDLTGLRTPCALIDRFQRELKRAMIVKHEHPRLRCGVLGVVRATGLIVPGDPVTVEFPSSSRQALPEL
jgi:MOSC domain-containing protein YiiM